MFRIFFFIFTLLFVVVLGLFPLSSSVLAVNCSVTIKSSVAPDNNLPGDYNGTIEVIPSQPDCFLATQEFDVRIYPRYDKDGKIVTNPFGSIPSFSTFVTASGRSSGNGRGVDCDANYCGKLEGDINLLFNPGISGTSFTIYNPGFHDNQMWKVDVCTDVKNPGRSGPIRGVTSCYDQNNIIATGGFFAMPLTTTPTPTGPKDLPEIDITALKECTYRSGEKDIEVKVKNILKESGKTYYWWWDGKRDYHDFLTTTGSETEALFTISKTETTFLLGKHRLCVDYVSKIGFTDPRSHTIQNCVTFNFQKDIISPEQSISCNPVTRGSAECTPDIAKACKDKKQICSAGSCIESIKAEGKPCDPANAGIQTAIGCVHTSPAGFIKDFLNFAVAISGGLAFLLMLMGAFQMITSAGNPETLQAGRERFQSAIIGLLFVIFAVLLLKIIGVDILGLGKQFGGP